MALYDYTYALAPGGEQLTFGASTVVWGGYVLEGTVARVPSPAFTADDYTRALLDLLPEGMAWPRDIGGILYFVVYAFAVELARLEARSAQLVAESDPASASELLADWERVVGLPDPCVTQAQTIGARRVALSGRLTAVGQQSRAFFIALAARLGYVVTIDEFASAAEATAAGIAFTGDEWAHIWRVNVAASVAVTPFRVGAGAVGEPLRSWSNEVLECQFERFKPAHTQVLFAYPT